MAFNNYYPVSYQSPMLYQQPSYLPAYSQALQNASNNSTSGIIWVQGEAGAKAYPVAPNTSVLLLDSEKDCFYIKTTDPSGMPAPLRVFEFTERTTANKPVIDVSASPAPAMPMQSYATKEDIERIERRIDSLVEAQHE